jgi:hypothetical protein
MTRFPSSQFWLLNPEDEDNDKEKEGRGSDRNSLSQSSVMSQFQSRGLTITDRRWLTSVHFSIGVPCSRITFVGRKGKEDHIRRYPSPPSISHLPFPPCLPAGTGKWISFLIQWSMVLTQPQPML